jgi:DNA-binding HxlR family transcriptional regulator
VSSRSYEQFCPLAAALDQVGERWTLLVVRELLAGPARFGDISEALPGLATNLLTKRLRALEDQGIVVQRELPPPARVKVYELTKRGHALEPVLVAMANWGTALMQPEHYKDPGNLRGMLLGFRMVPPQITEGLHARVNLKVGDECLGLVLDDGALDANYGELTDADATLTLTYQMLFGLLGGGLDIREAVKAGVVSADGSKQALASLGRAFKRAAALRAD